MTLIKGEAGISVIRIVYLALLAAVLLAGGVSQAAAQEKPAGGPADAGEVGVAYLGHTSYPSFTRLEFDTGGYPPERFKINYDEPNGRVVFYPLDGALGLSFPPVRLADDAVREVDFVQDQGSKIGIVVRLGRMAVGLRVSYLHDPERLVLDIYKKAAGRAFMPLYRGVRAVAIDPGHGGTSTGAAGESGLTEKDLTLEMAERLRRLLMNEGFEVFLTRTGDEDVSPAERAGSANNRHADLFVSLHTGGSFGSMSGGITVYTAEPESPAEKPASDAELLWSAQQSAYLPDSLRLARQLAGSAGNLYGVRATTRQARLAEFSGLAMPAVLIELGDLTDREQAAALSKDDFRERLAAGIAAGIVNYAKGVGR